MGRFRGAEVVKGIEEVSRPGRISTRPVRTFHVFHAPGPGVRNLPRRVTAPVQGVETQDAHAEHNADPKLPATGERKEPANVLAVHEAFRPRPEGVPPCRAARRVPP